jgi:hypothetical protein
MSFVPSKPFRVEYSETEAAEMLGITVENLRALVRSHIVKDEDPSVTVESFHQSDLLLLRLLAGIPSSRAHNGSL